MNRGDVDSFLKDGCGRCEKFQTPDCKVHLWTDALRELRALVNATELDEEMKWGSPCYTLGGKNVVAIAARTDSCALSFFKGSLLTNDDGVLEAPGPRSQAARLIKLKTAKDVRSNKKVIKRLLAEAIAAERAGKKVRFKKNPEPMPDELRAVLNADPALRAAFDRLTPGRQRSHIIHVGGAKQTKTRATRAEKCAVKIRAGQGFLDR
jgi:uncharacterized protein YdeI (YjbR/CyaY-like superfamily)